MTVKDHDRIRMNAFEDIYTERARQIIGEGYSAEKDDTTDGELALIAASYAAASAGYELFVPDGNSFVPVWPEGPTAGGTTKHTRRMALVMSAAVIVAEIERLDRASAKGDEG